MAQDYVKLADSQLFILKALANYRFLTVSQMLALDYDISRTQIYSKIKLLREGTKPLVQTIDLGSLPGKGRLDVIYYLSQHGALVLQDLGLELENINYPKRIRALSTDYLHRISSVDFHVAASLWAKSEAIRLDKYESYYDDGKKGPKGKSVQRTHISFGNKKFMPDAIFKFTTADDISRLCCFELHNGVEVKRLMEQLEVYCEALQVRAIEDSYNYPHSARVLLVFEQEKCLQKVQMAFQKRDDLADYRPNFFCKTVDEITDGNFKEDWHTLYDENLRPLFG